MSQIALTRKADNGRTFTFSFCGFRHSNGAGDLLVEIDYRPHMKIEKVQPWNISHEIDKFMDVWNEANPSIFADNVA